MNAAIQIIYQGKYANVIDQIEDLLFLDIDGTEKIVSISELEFGNVTSGDLDLNRPPLDLESVPNVDHNAAIQQIRSMGYEIIATRSYDDGNISFDARIPGVVKLFKGPIAPPNIAMAALLGILMQTPQEGLENVTGASEEPFNLEQPNLGDIYIADSPDSSIRRIVMISDFGDATFEGVNDLPIVEIYLCSNEIEMGGPHDVVLSNQESGLPYDLLVETDMQGTMYVNQLVKKLGSTDLSNLMQLLGKTPVGLPWSNSGKGSAKWAWKERELEALGALTYNTLRDFFKSEDEGTYSKIAGDLIPYDRFKQKQEERDLREEYPNLDILNPDNVEPLRCPGCGNFHSLSYDDTIPFRPWYCDRCGNMFTQAEVDRNNPDDNPPIVASLFDKSFRPGGPTVRDITDDIGRGFQVPKGVYEKFQMGTPCPMCQSSLYRDANGKIYCSYCPWNEDQTEWEDRLSSFGDENFVPPNIINEAKDWLCDNTWADMEEDEIMVLPDDKIIRAINQHYHGGMPQFIKDGEPVFLDDSGQKVDLMDMVPGDTYIQDLWPDITSKTADYFYDWQGYYPDDGSLEDGKINPSSPAPAYINTPSSCPGCGRRQPTPGHFVNIDDYERNKPTYCEHCNWPKNKDGYGGEPMEHNIYERQEIPWHVQNKVSETLMEPGTIQDFDFENWEVLDNGWRSYYWAGVWDEDPMWSNILSPYLISPDGLTWEEARNFILKLTTDGYRVVAQVHEAIKNATPNEEFYQEFPYDDDIVKVGIEKIPTDRLSKTAEWEDDPDNYDFDEEFVDEPQEDDIYVEYRGSAIIAYQNRKHILQAYNDYQLAKLIQEHMEKEGYYPNVWEMGTGQHWHGMELLRPDPEDNVPGDLTLPWDEKGDDYYRNAGIRTALDFAKGHYLTLFRGMTDKEYKDWLKGKAILKGKYFTVQPRQFHVNPQAVKQTSENTYALINDAQLVGSDTIEPINQGLMAWSKTASPDFFGGGDESVNGFKNWDTWNIYAMMDQTQEYQEIARNFVRNGQYDQLKDWALQTIIAPHNQTSLADAQEWNSFPEEERLDYNYEYYREKYKDNPEGWEKFVNLVGGPDLSDTKPVLYEEHLIDWNEVIEAIQEDIEEENRYAKIANEEDDLLNRIYEEINNVSNEAYQNMDPDTHWQIGDRVTGMGGSKVNPKMRQPFTGTIVEKSDLGEVRVQYDNPLLSNSYNPQKYEENTRLYPRDDWEFYNQPFLEFGWFWPNEVSALEENKIDQKWPNTLPWEEDEQDYYRTSGIFTDMDPFSDMNFYTDQFDPQKADMAEVNTYTPPEINIFRLRKDPKHFAPFNDRRVDDNEHSNSRVDR